MLGGVSIGDVQQVVQGGSPALLHVVGRAFGLGDAERNALMKNGVPWWVMLVGGAALGVVAGIQVQKRWPQHVPSILK